MTIRLEAKKSDETECVWQLLKQRVHDYLATQGLSNVLIERDAKLPTRDPRSGKFRHVWAELREDSSTPERQELREQISN